MDYNVSLQDKHRIKSCIYNVICTFWNYFNLIPPDRNDPSINSIIDKLYENVSENAALIQKHSRDSSGSNFLDK